MDKVDKNPAEAVVPADFECLCAESIGVSLAIPELLKGIKEAVVYIEYSAFINSLMQEQKLSVRERLKIMERAAVGWRHRRGPRGRRVVAVAGKRPKAATTSSWTEQRVHRRRATAQRPGSGGQWKNINFEENPMTGLVVAEVLLSIHLNIKDSPSRRGVSAISAASRLNGRVVPEGAGRRVVRSAALPTARVACAVPLHMTEVKAIAALHGSSRRPIPLRDP
ncbi:Protein of unknown function [Gryllus bimaculatus]|nr:Protein of unknown function [Gryllus bimaculatus]